jgi:outer membrane receptor protein involved in Fe transport
LVIKKDLSENHMIYASFSKGYKSGGYNAADDQNPEFSLVGGARVPNPTVPGIGFEYDDETAVSYEIGGKHTFPNGKLQFNWAAAHADYDNQQVSTFVGLGFVVGNAASSDVDTIEMDLLWQATPDLRIGVNAAYLDANFDSFPAAACTEKQLATFRAMDPTGNPYNPTGFSYTNIHQSNYGADLAIGNCKAIWNAAGFMAVGNQDLSGEPRGPGKYNGAVFADYTRNIGSDMQFFLSLDVSFFDDYTYAGDADPIDAQEASQQINIRAGVRADKWEAMVYGRNITDEIIAAGGFDVPLTSGAHAMYMAPREIWGARLTYNF